MSAKDIPMVPDRKASLPVVYGDTPSFLGCSVVFQVVSWHRELLGTPLQDTVVICRNTTLIFSIICPSLMRGMWS
jgi:hypothetical protein